MQEFGVDEIQGIKLYGLEQLTEEERKDMEAIISYMERRSIFLYYF